MNLTDVDDKTINRANEEGIGLKTLTEKFINNFFRDSELLNMLPADEYPAATDHIPIMIGLIQLLLNNNHAYTTDDGSVYFSIKSFKDYGKLARLDLTGQTQTNRVSTDDYSKDSLQDFALWKSWKKEDGDVHWDSPWGKGRPGWHIECSAMSMHYLGNHFDIHCGGTDNIFPHHENELAQSVAGNGSDFVNVWMHSEHLLVDGGKMSKSLGNFYRLKDLIGKGIYPEAIRLALLTGHYRSRLNFTLKKVAESKKTISRVMDFKDRLDSLNRQGDFTNAELPIEFDSFVLALDNDLNISEALAVFFEWIRKINTKLNDGNISAEEITSGLYFLDRFNFLFQIFCDEDDVPEEIMDLVTQREKSRNSENWKESDRIRDVLSHKGWLVEDTTTGTKIKKL